MLSAKRLRAVMFTMLVALAANAGLSYAGFEKSGVPVMPDVPRPKSGVPVMPDVPRPKSGVPVMPDVPRP